MNGASLEFLYRGRILPLTTLAYPSGEKRGWFDGGVRYRSGEICELGRQIKGPYENLPQDIDEAGLSAVNQSCVFGGMLQNEHFGHFVAESLSRLWAFTQLDNRFSTVAFYLRKPDSPVPNFINDLFKLLIPDVEVHIVRRVTQFDVLAVPQQLIHTGNSCVYGHPLMVQLCRRLIVEREVFPKKIFVSRSKLSRRNGGILGDHLIDKYLEEDGYTVIYPENLSVIEQLAFYCSADHLVFAEGSALHLYALVARSSQKVFSIWRRGRHSLFDWQVRSFSGQPVQGESCVKKLWVPRNEVPDAVHGLSVLDFVSLSEQLYKLGFVKTPRWDPPKEKELEEELTIISQKTKREFIDVLAPV